MKYNELTALVKGALNIAPPTKLAYMLLEKCGALNDIKHSDIECFTSGDFFRLRDLPPSDDDEIKGCIPVQAIEVSLISYAFGQPFSKCAEDVYTKMKPY